MGETARGVRVFGRSGSKPARFARLNRIGHLNIGRSKRLSCKIRLAR